MSADASATTDLAGHALAESTPPEVPRWSAGDAVLLLLAAMGALHFLGILLFALHLPDPELRRALGSLAASGMFLGAAVIGVRRHGHRDAERVLGIRIPQALDWCVGIPVGIALFFVSISIQEFINSHFAWWVSWYAAARQTASLAHGPWVLVDVMLLFTVPMGEESLFRGFLYRGLRARYSIITAAIVSGAVFSIAHYDPAVMPAIFVIGVALALTFEWRRSLAMPMLIHATINACFLLREVFG